MNRSYFQIALLGGVWFTLVTGISLPLLMSALPQPFAPGNMRDIGGQFSFALLFFGLAAGIVGFGFANRIARSDHGARVFGLGALLVLFTNLLAGAGLSVVGSRSSTLRAFLENSAVSAAGFLLLDLLIFKGAPFLLGGIAALAFRAGVQHLGWTQDDF